MGVFPNQEIPKMFLLALNAMTNLLYAIEWGFVLKGALGVTAVGFCTLGLFLDCAEMYQRFESESWTTDGRRLIESLDEDTSMTNILAALSLFCFTFTVFHFLYRKRNGPKREAV